MPMNWIPRFRSRPLASSGNGDASSRGQPLVSALSVGPDGAVPLRSGVDRRYLPAWRLIFLVYIVLLVRLVTLVDIGPTAYAHRMEELKSGSVLDRVVARVMYMDPVSRKLATEARIGMRKLGLR